MFYNLLDHKWGTSVMGTPSGDISYSADLSGLTASNGATTVDFENALDASFERWEGVAALSFVEGGSSVDIPIVTRSFLNEVAPFAIDGQDEDDGALGIAWIDDRINGLGEPNTPVLIEFNEDYDWSPTEVGAAGGINFTAVALHEIGHAIGLAHVNDDDQLMAAFLTQDDVQTGDIGGAQALYGLDAGDVEVEAEEESASSSGGGGGGFEDSGGGGGAGAGLLLGLLALLFGLGFGAPVAALAARFKDDDDVEDADQSADQEFAPGYTCDNPGCACHMSMDHHHHDNGFHPLFLPPIPAEDFAQAEVEDEQEDDLFLF